MFPKTESTKRICQLLGTGFEELARLVILAPAFHDRVQVDVVSVV
jgi:hypothetical protein